MGATDKNLVNWCPDSYRDGELFGYGLQTTDNRLQSVFSSLFIVNYSLLIV